MNWIKTKIHKQRIMILGNETSLILFTAIAGLYLAFN